MYGLQKRSDNVTNRIENLFRDFDNNLYPFFSHGSMLKSLEKEMPVTISESESDFKLEAVLPGIKKEDIDVTYENSILTIKAESKTEKKEEKDRVVVLDERSEFSYSRSFVIHDLDINKANAILQDGVLKMTLPKTENVKPKKISIK